MADTFIFPYSFEVLTEQPSDNRYFVESENEIRTMDERRKLRLLVEIETALQQDIELIKESDRFDFLYFLIQSFQEDVNPHKKGSSYVQEALMNQSNSGGVQGRLTSGGGFANSLQHQNLSMKIIEQTANILTLQLDELIKRIRGLQQKEQQQYQQGQSSNQFLEVMSARITFKMSIFLVFFFLHATCIKKKKSAAAVAVAQQSNVQQQQQTQRQDNSDDDHFQQSSNKKKKGYSEKEQKVNEENYKLLVEKQSDCLELLLLSIDTINIKELWQKRPVDDEFMRYYFSTCLKMLESKILMDNAQARERVFAILNENLVQLSGESERKDEMQQLQTRIINLLYEDENLVDPIVELLTTVNRGNNNNNKSQKITSSSLNNFTVELLQLLVTYVQEKTHHASESSAFKNANRFFSQLSRKQPQLFYNNLWMFLRLMDSDAYPLRQAVCDIISNSLQLVLSTNSEEDEEQKMGENNRVKAKEKLLNLLLKRIYDKHAYCRSHVLEIFQELVEHNILPADILKNLFRAAVLRTRDGAALVRKRAMQLVRVIITIYYEQFCVKQGVICFATTQDLVRDQAMTEEQNKQLGVRLGQLNDQFRQTTSQQTHQIDLEQDEEDHIQAEQQRQMLLMKDIEDLKKQIERNYSKLDGLANYLEILEITQRLTSPDGTLPQLLGSKQIMDVQEAIRLLATLKQFELQGNEYGMKKMLSLMWNKDNSIRQEVMQTYWKLYMDPKQFSPRRVAENLITLLQDANLTEQTNFEELLVQLLQPGSQKQHSNKQGKVEYDLKSDVFQQCWKIFRHSFFVIYEQDVSMSGGHKEDQQDDEYEEEEEEDQNLEDVEEQEEEEGSNQEGEVEDITKRQQKQKRKQMQQLRILRRKKMKSAMRIMRMVASVRPQEVSKKLEDFKELMNIFKKTNKRVDWIIVKEVACILELSKSHLMEDNMTIIIDIIKIMIFILLKNHGSLDTEWFIAAEQIVKLTFNSKNYPEALITFLITELSKFLQENEEETLGKKSTNTKKRRQKRSKAKDAAGEQNEELEIEKNQLENEYQQQVIQVEQQQQQEACNQQEEDENNNEEDNELVEEEEEEKVKDNIKEKELIFETKLSQSIFVAGECAMKLLMHIDQIEQWLKKRQVDAENKKQMVINNNQQQQQSKQQGKDAVDNDDELDNVHGGFEAEFEQKSMYLHQISDNILNDSPIFSYYCRLTERICWNILASLPEMKQQQQQQQQQKNENKFRSKLEHFIKLEPDAGEMEAEVVLPYSNIMLDRVAALSLVKYMVVSEQVCKENLDLLFTILENPQVDGVIKTNFLIGIGDLQHRFPKLIEPRLTDLYASLRDTSPRVRQTCLMVITHLVLGDLLKVRTDIFNIALLINDPEQKIQDQVKLFFHELNRKDPKAIQKNLPDIIDHLSDKQLQIEASESQMQQQQTGQDVFQTFAGSVLQTSLQDKQVEPLVEKLLSKMQLTKNELAWRNISYVLSLLSYNEKSIQIMLANFEIFREKLEDKTIWQNFKNIAVKAKQFVSFSKQQEYRSLLEEFEAKVNNYKKENFDDNKYRKQRPQRGNAGGAGNTGNQAGQQQRNQKNVGKNLQKKGNKRQVNRQQSSDSEQEQNEQIEFEGDSDYDNQRKRMQQKNTAKNQDNMAIEQQGRRRNEIRQRTNQQAMEIEQDYDEPYNQEQNAPRRELRERKNQHVMIESESSSDENIQILNKKLAKKGRGTNYDDDSQ